MASGINVDKLGMNTNSKVMMIITPRYGIAPLKIPITSVPGGVTAFTEYTHRPTGGVRPPMCSARMQTISNWIGSMPNATAAG